MPHAESPGRQWLRLWTWGFAAYPVLGVMAAIQDEVNAVNAGRPAHWLALFVTNYAYHFSYILFVPPLFLLVRRFPLDRAHWKGSAPVLLAVTLGLVVVKIAIIEPLEAQVFALGATFGSHVMGSMYDVWAGDAELKALLASLKSRQPYPERFLVRAAQPLYFVNAADIEWAKSASNYVRLHIGGRPHLVRGTLTAIAAKLPPERFVRVHRSVIVNLDHIGRLEPSGHGEYRITLKDGRRITSSRSHNAVLRELLR